MSENFGYNNKMLRVDLDTGSLQTEEIGEKILRKYIGGTSLGLYYLLKEISEKIDPLSRDNKLFFTTSPLTGAGFSGNARNSVTTVSPLTGGVASSEAGGWWGPALKLAGLDAIAVEGVSSEPQYLYIEDNTYKLLDAGDIWGQSTYEVQRILKERHGKIARVLQIGPAGENLVRFSCIMNEVRHFHGRGGTGAVMGYKKLRAIVVKNSRKKLPVADAAHMKVLTDYANKDMRSHPALGPHHDLGTTRFLLPTNAGGMLPTRNFQDGEFEDAEKVSGEEIDRMYGGGSHTCYMCNVSCKRKLKSVDGGAVDFSLVGGPEYESMTVLGPLLGINDPAKIVELNALCNSFGLDTISTGVTIAWLIEALEREPGLEIFEGLEPIGWNNPDRVLELVKMIVARDGFGAILAEGSRMAAEKAGGDTLGYAMQVKGQEFPAHEPRGKWNVGLGMAVNAAGADHLVVAHDVVLDHEGDPGPVFGGADLSDVEPIGLLDALESQSLSPEKIRNFVYLQQLWTLHDVLSVCKFLFVPETRTYTLKHIVELLESATGWKTSLFDLMKCSERTINMARLFNFRMGFTRKDDRLPERMFEPIGNGPLQGKAIDRDEFDRALDLYYEMMGWDDSGLPGTGKLVELGIEEFAG